MRCQFFQIWKFDKFCIIKKSITLILQNCEFLEFVQVFSKFKNSVNLENVQSVWDIQLISTNQLNKINFVWKKNLENLGNFVKFSRGFDRCVKYCRFINFVICENLFAFWKIKEITVYQILKCFNLIRNEQFLKNLARKCSQFCQI